MTVMSWASTAAEQVVHSPEVTQPWSVFYLIPFFSALMSPVAQTAKATSTSHGVNPETDL